MTRNTRIAAILVVAGSLAGLWAWWSGAPGGGEGRDRGGQPVLVTLATASPRAFVNLIDAVGTARANESIELTAKSADTVARLNFTDGQAVPAGHVVAEMTQREQSADQRAAEANLREQDQALQRARKLRAAGFVTQASLDAATAARDSAAARVAATKSRAADRIVTTPFAGVLGLRRVSVGALVRPGEVITTLDDITRIKVDFAVAETQMAGVSKGQAVRATAAAYPGETFTGAVDSIDTRIDPASRTITVRAIFPNAGRRLLPGMLMNVGIESNRRTTLGLPEQCLVPVESRQYVYVVEGEDKAERREVTIGQRVPGFVEILSGLKPGDRVVLDGTLKMRPGATIRLAGQDDGKGRDPAARGRGGRDGAENRKP